jgi:hypothetical protein
MKDDSLQRMAFAPNCFSRALVRFSRREAARICGIWESGPSFMPRRALCHNVYGAPMRRGRGSRSAPFEDLPAMPQPIARIVKSPHIVLAADALDDKPDLAILVTKIFATWARIEQELKFLLVRVLGADAAPAIAMFQTLTAQHLQLGALDAAAKAALSLEDFQIFGAAVSTAECAQTPRNHLGPLGMG